MKTFIFILLFSQAAMAEENWFCTSQSAKMEGNTLYSCGIGVAFSEQEAREEAYRKSVHQLQSLCDISGTCREHRLAVTPARMSCEHGKPIENSIMFQGQIEWKCYGLLLFTITS